VGAQRQTPKPTVPTRTGIRAGTLPTTRRNKRAAPSLGRARQRRIEALYPSTPPTAVRVTAATKRPPGGREGAARRASPLIPGQGMNSVNPSRQFIGEDFMSEKEVFWQNFFSATALTPSLDVSLYGESGIAHTFPAIGTGDNRMVLITSEPDPIKAQLIGFDIQKKYKADKVILSRASIADTKDLVSKFAMRFAGGGVETFKVRFED
jgi:hypothetical protein